MLLRADRFVHGLADAALVAQRRDHVGSGVATTGQCGSIDHLDAVDHGAIIRLLRIEIEADPSFDERHDGRAEGEEQLEIEFRQQAADDVRARTPSLEYAA